MSDEHDRLMDIIEEATKRLGEHFDSVRIIATLHSPDETKDTASFTTGHGNYFAQYGSVRQWLMDQDAMVKRKGWDSQGDGD